MSTTPNDYITGLLDRAMLEAVHPIAARYSGQGSQWRYPYAKARPRAASATASVWFTAYPGAIITREGQLTAEIVSCLGSCVLAPVAVLDGQVMGRMRQDAVLRQVRRSVSSDQ